MGGRRVSRGARVLRDHLRVVGLSQSDFARQVSCSRQMIHLLCTDRAVPSLQLANDIEEKSGGAVPVVVWLRGRLMKSPDG